MDLSEEVRAQFQYVFDYAPLDVDGWVGVALHAPPEPLPPAQAEVLARIEHEHRLWRCECVSAVDARGRLVWQGTGTEKNVIVPIRPLRNAWKRGLVLTHNHPLQWRDVAPGLSSADVAGFLGVGGREVRVTGVDAYGRPFVDRLQAQVLRAASHYKRLAGHCRRYALKSLEGLAYGPAVQRHLEESTNAEIRYMPEVTLPLADILIACLIGEGGPDGLLRYAREAL